MRAARTNQSVDYRDELLRAFHMRAEDLDANRAGRLGDRQARRLSRGGTCALLLGIAMATAVVAIVVLVAERPLEPVQVVLAALLAGAVLAVGAVMFHRGRAAARRSTVLRVTGPTFARMRGRAGWYLIVGQRSFRLPIRFWHVKNGETYHVYFTPIGNLIVAMEPAGWA